MNQDTAPLRILVIEDDPRMLELLCRGLREFGHTVMPAADGDAGLNLAVSVQFDLIILDVGLPCRDGYEVTKILRERKKTPHILMLTARDAEDDIIRGLDTGADDYLLKPFSFPELVARIHSLTRSLGDRVAEPKLILEHSRMTAIRDGVTVQLSRAEFTLLATLHAHASPCASREYLACAVWGEDHTPSANQLDVLVNALRNKLDAPFSSKIVETVRGVGYRLRLEEPVLPATQSPSRKAPSEEYPREVSA